MEPRIKELQKPPHLPGRAQVRRAPVMRDVNPAIELISPSNKRMICYVINLERHQARMQSFLQQFHSSDLTALELRRFRAVDATSVGPHARALVYEPAIARLAGVKRRGFRQTHAEIPSMGGIGCALSHLCTWLDILYDAAAPSSQRYLVMEDDADLPRRLLASVNKALQGVPAGWDILLLGYRSPRPSMVTKHTTHVNIRLFQGTHAYLVTKAAVRKIFENGALPLRVQIDAFLSGLAQAKKLTIYAVPKRLVGVNLMGWGSSIQLDYDFEHSHAELTYDHPFEMATGSTGVDDLQRLDALRRSTGLTSCDRKDGRLTRPKKQGRTRITKQLCALLIESAPNKRLQATPHSLRCAPASGRA